MSSEELRIAAGEAPVRSSLPLWFLAFILLLVLMPLPFGSNRPWASDLFAILTGLILSFMLWHDHDVLIASGNAPRKRLLFSAVSLTAVIIWAFCQVVPWTPASWHHPLWQEATNVIGSVKSSVSVDTGVFPESLIRFVGYIGCFLIAFVAGRDPIKAKALVKALAITAVVYALYGLIVQSTGSDTILWYKKWSYFDSVTSTFVNKNSYATYAGLGLLCCLVFLYEHFKKITPKDAVLARQSRAVALFASLAMRDYALLIMPLILLAALVLTVSRAGVASSVLGIIVFFLTMALHHKRSAGRWIKIATAGIGLFVLVLGLGGDALLSALADSQMEGDSNARLAGYKLVGQAITANPWLGYGLGTFDSAFRLYRDASLPLWFHHAHNDYLEMAMDLGLPALGLILLSLFSLLSCCLQGLWTRRKNGIYPALALSASFLVGAHAFVDFSLHIPAIAATYAALLGVGVAQSWTTREG